MNVIANDRTHVPHLIIVVLVMVGISLWLLRWARRQDGGDVVVAGLPRDLRQGVSGVRLSLILLD